MINYFAPVCWKTEPNGREVERRLNSEHVVGSDHFHVFAYIAELTRYTPTHANKADKLNKVLFEALNIHHYRINMSLPLNIITE